MNAGLHLAEMLDLVGTLHDQLTALAEALADQIIDRVWQPLADQDRSGEFEQFLQRGRALLLQGVASTLADRLGDAILHRADRSAAGDALRAAIDHVRVGAVTDGTGTIHRRHP